MILKEKRCITSSIKHIWHASCRSLNFCSYWFKFHFHYCWLIFTSTVVYSTVKWPHLKCILSKILSLDNRPTLERKPPVEHHHHRVHSGIGSPKIEKSSCYREISNELITSERPMRTHNRQQMADAMPDVDAVSPVIESTLSVSIMVRGSSRVASLCHPYTTASLRVHLFPLQRCSLSVVIVNEGGTFDWHCFCVEQIHPPRV